MSQKKITKLTVVSENILKEKIIALLEQFGATGYTILACEGKGSKGNNSTDWQGRNVEIYTLIEQEAAEQILSIIEEKFMKNFSIIVYTSEIDVVRNKKFTSR